MTYRQPRTHEGVNTCSCIAGELMGIVLDGTALAVGNEYGKDALFLQFVSHLQASLIIQIRDLFTL